MTGVQTCALPISAERSEVRREAVGFQFQPKRLSMQSIPSQCPHPKCSFPFRPHLATKFPEYPAEVRLASNRGYQLDRNTRSRIYVSPNCHAGWLPFLSDAVGWATPRSLQDPISPGGSRMALYILKKSFYEEIWSSPPHRPSIPLTSFPKSLFKKYVKGSSGEA